MVDLSATSGGWHLSVFPGVDIRFHPITRRTWRAAQRAAARMLAEEGGVDADPDVLEDAGDVISQIVIERGIAEWRGVFGEGDAPIAPDHLFPLLDADGAPVLDADGEPQHEAAVTRFLADPHRFERLDAIYVMPFVQRSLEGNVSAGSPIGTSSEATPAPVIVSSAAPPMADRDATPAPTARTPSGRTKRKRSGKS